MTSLQGTKAVAPKCPDLGGSTVNGCKIGVCISYKVLRIDAFCYRALIGELR